MINFAFFHHDHAPHHREKTMKKDANKDLYTKMGEIDFANAKNANDLPGHVQNALKTTHNHSDLLNPFMPLSLTYGNLSANIWTAQPT